MEGKSLSWCALDRPAELEKARRASFDLVIVGGGVTGAGVAREAALRGLTFLLVDKEDFAFGTSSRSSKLAHGGFRYLSQGEFRLVRESTTERNWLRTALPNLVRPLGFYFLSQKGGKDTPGRVKLGVVLYDLLSNAFSRFKNAHRHRFFGAREMARREPALRTDNLLMAGYYFDTNVDDSRLTLETIKEARDASGGRSVALNYVAARRVVVEDGHVTGVELEDREGGGAFRVRAGCVVNATGIWTDETLALAGVESHMIRPTKGVHVVVRSERVGNREAFALRSIDDGRTFFVMRRGEVSVIGTTDTDFQADLDTPWCEGKDCDYLLRTVNDYFPEARLTREDVLATYAGVRPLIRQEGLHESSVSRKHVIQDPGTGLVTIAGGKLTTFRTMGFEALMACSRGGYIRPLKGRQARRHFSRRPYKAGITWESFQASARAQELTWVSEELLRHLHQQYGQAAFAILREIKGDPALGEPFLAGHPFCPAEIHHILAFENTSRLADVMMRRTEMQILVPSARQEELARSVARVMAVRLGWSPEREGDELARWMDIIRQTLV
jgi:glycerol-3-phosphate dehydrogenase